MSSHNCRISGRITVKGGGEVTSADVEKALVPFLVYHGHSYSALVAAGQIALDDCFLELSIDFSGVGGYWNEQIEGLVDRLGSLVADHGYLEFEDFDTGSSDDACTPFFIAATPAQRSKARLAYGIEQMKPWVQPVIGVHAFDAVVKVITAMPPIAHSA